MQVTGVGLHTGEPCRVTFRPALPGTGVVFTRRHPKREGEWQSVPADVQYVVDTRLATTLGKEEFRISTVEHCLCAMSRNHQFKNRLLPDSESLNSETEGGPMRAKSLAQFTERIPSTPSRN